MTLTHDLAATGDYHFDRGVARADALLRRARRGYGKCHPSTA